MRENYAGSPMQNRAAYGLLWPKLAELTQKGK